MSKIGIICSLLLTLCLSNVQAQNTRVDDDIYYNSTDAEKDAQKLKQAQRSVDKETRNSRNSFKENGDYQNDFSDNDYIDYDNDDYYYSTQINRFYRPFYYRNYWSSFYDPFWYDPYWHDPNWGWSPWYRPTFSISFGYGPYWNSYGSWYNWCGYGGFNSYYNYPSYIGGYYGYGNGYYNSYWNGYYAGLYNGGYKGRTVSYGPRYSANNIINGNQHSQYNGTRPVLNMRNELERGPRLSSPGTTVSGDNNRPLRHNNNEVKGRNEAVSRPDRVNSLDRNERPHRGSLNNAGRPERARFENVAPDDNSTRPARSGQQPIRTQPKPYRGNGTPQPRYDAQPPARAPRPAHSPQPSRTYQAPARSYDAPRQRTPSMSRPSMSSPSRSGGSYNQPSGGGNNSRPSRR